MPVLNNPFVGGFWVDATVDDVTAWLESRSQAQLYAFLLAHAADAGVRQQVLEQQAKGSFISCRAHVLPTGTRSDIVLIIAEGPQDKYFLCKLLGPHPPAVLAVAEGEVKSCAETVDLAAACIHLRPRQLGTAPGSIPASAPLVVYCRRRLLDRLESVQLEGAGPGSVGPDRRQEYCVLVTHLQAARTVSSPTGDVKIRKLVTQPGVQAFASSRDAAQALCGRLVQVAGQDGFLGVRALLDDRSEATLGRMQPELVAAV